MNTPALSIVRGFSWLAVIVSLGSSMPQRLTALDTPALEKPLSSSPATAAKGTEEANRAWEEVRKVSPNPAPPPPAEWRTKQPTSQEYRAWKDTEIARLRGGADKAHDFATRFPTHEKAGAARDLETQLLRRAVQSGDKESSARLVALEKQQLDDPSTTPDARLKIRTRQVWQDIRTPRGGGNAYETGGRALLQEFADKPDAGYGVLLQGVSYSADENARPLITEILASKASETLKTQAKGLLRRIDAVGKPLDIQFTALDGRAVNLQAMKGKVVLINFWATWCGPCVAETPNMKAAYDKLHDKGFEIIGLSFDSDKAKLEQYVKDKALPWPQFFDGTGWDNKYSKEFAIRGIPTMWLVDKKGVLRDPHARGQLESKVEKLLAE